MEYVVGVDIGGTFTDCTVLDGGGNVTLAKAFSTPPDFADGIVDSLASAAETLQVELSFLLARTRLFLHSTTVAENAIVNGDLATAGVLTTRGHEDTLAAMRGGYGRWSGLTDDEKRNPVETDKPPPIVPRRLIRGIAERTDAQGAVLKEADAGEIAAAAASLLEAGAEGLGVCFLWSIANPANERLAREVIERLHPGVQLTLSHEIAPSIGEYERTSTVALNARLRPVVARYLDTLRDRLTERGFAGQLLVMQAYGGLLPLATSESMPVGMIESGPVSGLLASQRQGELLGFPNIIAADMGGTTFKVGIVRGGLIEYQREPTVFRYHYALPKMDVVSLGLAGGSVVWVDPRTGIPQIGPRSAGSYPGPVCYDHGGTEPTVTDVDAILGYLNPRFFVGGRVSLNLARAKEVFEATIADSLGMSLLDAAAAVYRLANSMIYDLLHRATIQRGLDPRHFCLFSYGGTAGMHVAAYGDELGVERIVVPATASVQGAFGLIVSDVVHEEQVTRPTRFPPEAERLERIFGELERRIRAQLEDEGFSADEIALERSIDMSYHRQTHVLTVPLEADAIGEAVERFERLYRERYGQESGYREAGIDLVSFRVRGRGRLRKPEPAPLDVAPADPSPALVETREAWVDGAGEIQLVPGFDFELLAPGNVIAGPAIVWTPITTVVVGAGQVARVDPHRNIVIAGAEREVAAPFVAEGGARLTRSRFGASGRALPRSAERARTLDACATRGGYSPMASG